MAGDTEENGKGFVIGQLSQMEMLIGDAAHSIHLFYFYSGKVYQLFF